MDEKVKIGGRITTRSVGRKSKKIKKRTFHQVSNDTTRPPTRDCSNLFASSVTVKCALENRCVPCAYKVGCFDVALDQEFCRQVPNQRPETCPRARATGGTNSAQAQKDKVQSNKKRRRQLYPSVGNDIHTGHVENGSNHKRGDGGRAILGCRTGMRVLTCGDGDFSFSLAIARRFRDDSSNKPLIDLVATSYEDKETLQRVYPKINDTVMELDRLGVKVCYQVDATRLYETLPYAASKSPESGASFHRIYWNFPCTAIDRGQDGQNREMEDNKDLVRKFVQQHFAQGVQDSCLLHPTEGEIHICHKTKPPFDQWRLEHVALENINTKTNIEKDAPQELCFAGRIVLDRFLFPPYTPRKALDRKSFPCHDACFYVFSRIHQIKCSSGGFDSADAQFAPTIPDLKHGSNVSVKPPDCHITPVNGDLISTIRTELLRASRSPSNAFKKNSKKRKR